MASAASYKFYIMYFHFHPVQNIKFPLILPLWSMCYLKVRFFNFHILGEFSDIFLFPTSGLILLWSENLMCIITVLLNSFRSSWPRMWSILELLRTCVLLSFWWIILEILIRSGWLIMLFESPKFLLMFCLFIL